MEALRRRAPSRTCPARADGHGQALPLFDEGFRESDPQPVRHSLCRMVFALLPRRQGLWGSWNRRRTSVAAVNLRAQVTSAPAALGPSRPVEAGSNDEAAIAALASGNTSGVRRAGRSGCICQHSPARLPGDLDWNDPRSRSVPDRCRDSGSKSSATLHSGARRALSRQLSSNQFAQDQMECRQAGPWPQGAIQRPPARNLAAGRETARPGARPGCPKDHPETRPREISYRLKDPDPPDQS